MKKIFLTTILTILLSVGVVQASSTLYEYYQGKLPSIADRAKIATEAGLIKEFGEYKGTYSQNTALLNYLQNTAFSIGSGGGTAVTDFESTLTVPLTASTTTIPVASMNTFDNHTLVTADIEPAVYLILEAGGAKQEIIKCTGIAGLYFTDCTRGLAFYGRTETAVTANKKTHSAGTTVTLSNVHYYYLSLNDTNTWTSIQTFASSTDDDIQQITFGTSTPSYFESNAGVLYYCNNGASCATIGGGANTYSFITPLGVSGSEVSIATSTNEFDLDGSNNLSIKLNNSLTSNSSGVAVNTTTNYLWTGNSTTSGSVLFSGDATHTGSTTFEKVPSGIVTIGDGSDGAFTATSTSRLTPAKIWEFTSLTVGAGTELSNEATSTVLHIRVNGNCVINGNINLNGKGGVKGLGGATGVDGTNGSSSNTYKISSSTSMYGVKGTHGNPGGGGVGGGRIDEYLWYADNAKGLRIVFPGAGGGGGGGSYEIAHAGGGNGGNGGGTLILECKNLSGSGTISANGEAGIIGGSGNQAGGGGGGGGGGMLFILYDILNWDGTTTVSGGAGGAGGVGTTAATGGGGGGGGGGYNTGSGGGGGGTNGGVGGAGATGIITIQQIQF